MLYHYATRRLAGLRRREWPDSGCLVAHQLQIPLTWAIVVVVVDRSRGRRAVLRRGDGGRAGQGLGRVQGSSSGVGKEPRRLQRRGTAGAGLGPGVNNGQP